MRKILGAISAVCLICTLGIVGSIENGAGNVNFIHAFLFAGISMITGYFATIDQ